jgi:uncharacterized MnhB-related membrane protein
MSSFVEIIHISILIMMIVAGFLAVVLKKLLPSVIALSVASLLLSLEFYILHAPDVAIAEAAIRGTR